MDFPCIFCRDFLTETHAPVGTEMLLTNPPAILINRNKFITHALDLCPRVILLGPLTRIASARRKDVMERRGLARIHVFAECLPMMHRDGWGGPKAISSATYAWFVWEREYADPTVIDRI